MKPLRYLGVVLVALVLLGWLGDVPGRYRASQAHQRGQSALLNNDWSGAFSALREAVGRRPTDPDYRRDFDQLQEKWVRYQQELAVNDSPEVTQARLEGEPATLAQLLMEPHATQYRNFARRVRDQVEARIAAAAGDALELAGQKKFSEAYAALEKLRPLEKYFPPLDERFDTVRRAELREAFARASAALERRDFAAARQALDAVRPHAALLPGDFETAEQQLCEREFVQQLATAVETAARGEFASARRQLEAAEARARELDALPWFARALEAQLAREEPARRAALGLSGRLAEARAAVRRMIVQRSAERLAVALARRDEGDAQATLDELARLSDRRFSLTADDLLRERELDVFLSHLVALGLRPASEAERMNRADLIVVETMRANFSAPERVAEFLGRGYREWAEEVRREGHPGLSLYLARQARASGAAAAPEWENENRAALMKNFRTSIRLLPTAQIGAGGAVPDRWHDVLRDTIARSAGGWLRLAEGDPAEPVAFLLRPELAVAPDEHAERKFDWNVRYQSGVQNIPNPDYQNLTAQLHQAQYAYEQARNTAAQTRSNSQYYANAGLVGALTAAATTGYSDGAVEAAANRVNQLNQQLANTPAYYTNAQYADEVIPVTMHTVNHAAALDVKLFDGADVIDLAHWEANLRYTTREWPGSGRANVAARAPALLNPGAAGERLGHNPGAKLAAQSSSLLHPLAAVLAKKAEQKFGSAPLLAQAESAWAQVELWEPAGVTLDDRSAREATVRRALGLPVGAPAAAKAVEAGRAWRNSLGLPLVPVAGTSVLFCAWETRWQDFDLFVKETGHDAITNANTLSIGPNGWAFGASTWKAPGFAQEPTHPVTCVNFADAQAFCAWLTQKERAAGLIGPQQRYRLPTDAEWSVAAGLRNEAAGSPEQKRRKAPGFGWGAEWPPRAGTANIGGFEARDLPGWPNWLVLDDYGDGFAGTSPVGMFSANAWGLHDLDGNVQEWCDDPDAAAGTKRVTRGACFSYCTAEQLMLSERSIVESSQRFTVVGFRVVLELAPPPPL